MFCWHAVTIGRILMVSRLWCQLDDDNEKWWDDRPLLYSLSDSLLL